MRASKQTAELLIAELRGNLPWLNDAAGRTLAIAQALQEHGPRRDFERVGIRLVDLVAAIGALGR